MNILVTGATSAIGSHIAAGFAAGNHLYLSGREPSRLIPAERLCRAGGARSVQFIVSDLKDGATPILEAIAGTPIHLLIHAASTLSRLRDQEIPIDALSALVQAEVLTPVELIRNLLDRAKGERVAMLCVSSILAVVPTPRRAIYGRLKGLLEQALFLVESQRANLDLRVLRVSKVVDRERDNGDWSKVAAAAKRALAGRKHIVSYGRSGQILEALYNIQPLAFRGLMNLRRLIQRST